MTWLEKEESNLIKERLKNTDKTIFLRVCLYGLFALLCSSHALFSVEEPQTSCGFFPATWVCSNPKCGYTNYEGINHCALCGTKKKGS